MERNETARMRDRELFSAWTQRNSRERRRERNNWKVYDATEFGQWDETSLRQLISEGRPPHQFNFVKKTVDTLAGSSLAEPYDIHYTTEIGESNDIAILFNELYLEDRDLGHFMFHYLQQLRAGFVYRGWLEMFKDYSRGLPRVGLRYLSGDRVVTDPDWTTNNVKDNKALYLPAWMSPQQIKDKYKRSSDLLEVHIALFKEFQHQSAQGQEVEKLFDRSPEFWDEQNGLFLVWDKLVLEQVNRTRLYDYDTGTWLPTTDEGQAQALFDIGRQEGRNLAMLPKQELVCKVYSQCPALLLELQNGKHPLQLNRYPLFAFSSDCINGRPNTPVDQLKDVQEAFNKRESVKTHILMTNANNHVLVESDAFDTPAKAEDFIKRRNRPGGGSVVEPGTNQHNKIRHLDRAAPPREFVEDANHLWQIGEKLTPAVPAVQGMGDEGESGVLFQSRVAQAQIGMQIATKFLAALWHEVGDAYFDAAQQTYTYPMMFRSQRTGQVWWLNYEDGLDMKTISRMRVTVTQSPASESYRRLLLQTYLSINQALTSPLSKQALSRMVIQSIPNVPEEEKNALTEITKMEEDYQRDVVALNHMQVKMSMFALTQQMAQMQAQAQMMGGMPGAPGAPPGPGGPAPMGQANPQALMAQILGNPGNNTTPVTQTV